MPEKEYVKVGYEMFFRYKCPRCGGSMCPDRDTWTCVSCSYNEKIEKKQQKSSKKQPECEAKEAKNEQNKGAKSA